MSREWEGIENHAVFQSESPKATDRRTVHQVPRQYTAYHDSTPRTTNLVPEHGGSHGSFIAQEACIRQEFKVSFMPYISTYTFHRTVSKVAIQLLSSLYNLRKYFSATDIARLEILAIYIRHYLSNFTKDVDFSSNRHLSVSFTNNNDTDLNLEIQVIIRN